MIFKTSFPDELDQSGSMRPRKMSISLSNFVKRNFCDGKSLAFFYGKI